MSQIPTKLIFKLIGNAVAALLLICLSVFIAATAKQVLSPIYNPAVCVIIAASSSIICATLAGFFFYRCSVIARVMDEIKGGRWT